MFLRHLEDRLARYQDYLEQNAKYCRQHPAAQVSQFWQEHFADRPNLPTAEQFVTFRRSEFLYGIGETRPADVAAKRLEYAQILRSISLFTPLEFLKKLNEPLFGAPLVLSEGDLSMSAGYLLNAGTCWRISQLLDRFETRGTDLDIVEIGAGWGACASQLHQILDISTYTILDLPENLCLSSTYLSMSFPNSDVSFLSCEPSAANADPRGHELQFGLPPAMDNLTRKIDVVLNTLSFQEMDAESVEAYFNFARDRLRPDGLLISFNSHAKAGIGRASQYLKDGFELLHMQPFRSVPAGLFNTIPYEMVFRKSELAPTNDDAVIVNAYAEMAQMGIDFVLQAEEGARLSESLEAAERAKASLLCSFFYETDEAMREDVAARLLTDHRSAETLFVVANLHFAAGKEKAAAALLEEALENGLAGFASVRAHLILALTCPERAAGHIEYIKNHSGGLYEAAKEIIDTGNTAAIKQHIARVLRYPLPPAKLGRSLATRLKRRVWPRPWGAR